MELRQLRYFLAVSRTLNFTRAAEEMHVAQPPLSRQISSLEEELGTRLIDREARPVRLTEAGNVFRERAAEILSRIDRLKDETTSAGRTGRQTLKIGFEVSVLYGRLPGLLKRLRCDHPQLQFDLVEMTTSEQVRSLKDGTIDLGFGRELVVDEQIEQVMLRQEPILVAIPPNNPLAYDARSSLRLSDLVQETFIVYSHGDRGKGTNPLLRMFEAHAFVPAQKVEIRDLPAALGLVAAEIGICLVPAIGQRMRLDDVCYKKLDDPAAKSFIVMNITSGNTSAIVTEIRKQLDLFVDPLSDSGH